MSRRVDHEKFGRFVAIETFKDEVSKRGLHVGPLGMLIASAWATWLGRNIAVLPDRLEPAVSPDHRAAFHSADVARALETVKGDIWNNPSDDWQVDVGLMMGISAYQSHIILDSTTPMGVPDYQWLIDLLESFNQKQLNS